MAKAKRTPLEEVIMLILEHEGPMTPDALVKRVQYFWRRAFKQRCPTCGK